MARPRRQRVPTPAPAPPAAEMTLPSDTLGCRVSLKLDAQHRRILDDVRRRLTDPLAGHYPTVSVVMRRALTTLYHSLPGHPPGEEVSGGQP